MKSFLSPRLAAPLGLALIAALGGCTPVNRGLESVHQPIVSSNDYAFDVAVGGSGLAAGETARLAGWFDSLRLGYGDSVAIDDPAPYGHPASRDAIAAVAARYGLLVGADAPVTVGAVAPGAVRVIVSRASARVDHCPDWDRPAEPVFDASTSSNYGCAVNANLAAMVANPEDLVRGQIGSGTGDAATSAKAIASYRTAEPTGKAGVKEEATAEGGK